MASAVGETKLPFTEAMTDEPQHQKEWEKARERRREDEEGRGEERYKEE